MDLIEISRQHGEQWVERKLIAPEDVAKEVARFPDDSWYVTTFTLLECVDKPTDNIAISTMFERQPKKGDLFFDFDSSDIDKAKADCKSVYEHLTNSLGVNPRNIKVYYSGSKGYHLLVDFDVLGISPRRDLHTLYRRLATGFANTIAKNNTLDLKIYNPRRLFRVPNTKHQKTGKLKEEVSLMNLGISVKADSVPLVADTVISPQLKEALEKIETREEDKLKTWKRLPREFLLEPLDCVIDVLNNGVPNGMWNDTVYTLALYFKGLGLDKAEVYDKIEKSKIAGITKPDMREVSRTITSAYGSDKRFGLKDNVLEDYVTAKDRERWRLAKIDEEYESLNQVVDSLIKFVQSPQQTLARYYVDILDKKMGGINGGELVVLGGATGTGKSEFAFHTAYENAKRGVPTAFISLELSNRDFIARIVRSRSGIEAERFWAGDLNEAEKARVQEIAEELKEENHPLFFRKKKAMMTLEELESIVSSLIIEQQCRLIVIDHLHYMGGKSNSDTENYHVSQSIRAINNLAVRYNVGIICIAHFRKIPNNAHRPSLHEFRDTSAIEQEAATVLILWRDMDGFGDDQCVTEFRLAKSRKDIPLGIFKTKFNKSTRNYDTL